MLKICLLIILGLQIFHSYGQEQQIATKAEELNLTFILDRISKTTAEGAEVLEKVKRLAPEKQSSRSAKTLGDAINDCTNGHGECRISPIGWEAVETTTGHWNISFYFMDEEQKYQKATWEYIKKRNVLIPTEFANALKFWVRRSEKKRP